MRLRSVPGLEDYCLPPLRLFVPVSRTKFRCLAIKRRWSSPTGTRNLFRVPQRSGPCVAWPGGGEGKHRRAAVKSDALSGGCTHACVWLGCGLCLQSGARGALGLQHGKRHPTLPSARPPPHMHRGIHSDGWAQAPTVPRARSPCCGMLRPMGPHGVGDLHPEYTAPRVCGCTCRGYVCPASRSMSWPSIPMLYPQNITASSSPGYLTPAVSGAHEPVGWPHRPCLLGVPNTGTKNGGKGGTTGAKEGKTLPGALTYSHRGFPNTRHATSSRSPRNAPEPPDPGPPRPCTLRVQATGRTSA